VLTDLATLVLADSSICRIRLYNGVPFVSGKLVGFFVTVPSPHTIEAAETLIPRQCCADVIKDEFLLWGQEYLFSITPPCFHNQ